VRLAPAERLILDAAWGERGFRQPSAFLRMDKAFADFFVPEAGLSPPKKTGSFFGSHSGTPSGDLSERDYIMIDPDEANRAYTSAHAIAGFQLADIAFGVLVRNGILPKSDAERLLTQAIAGNRSRNHQAAAELLGIVLQSLSEFQPAPRH
jgi:hypothetical protein